MILIYNPNCEICTNAKEFLDENKIKYQTRNIINDTPTKEELEKIIKLKDISVNQLFNRSDLMYKQLHLKDKIFLMSDLEKLEILSSNGTLINRPILLTENDVLIGFDLDEWKNKLL